MLNKSSQSSTNNWKDVWQIKQFKVQFIVGMLALIILLICFPIFFNFIEKRNGTFINDWLLNQLPSVNLSIPIFSLIWFGAILTVWKAYKNPRIFLLFLWSYIFLSLSRMISITSIPLNPPSHLIPLVDPISNAFYGGIFITKDLFYSGHTSTLFMMYLCLQKSWQKNVVLIATCLVGTMLLFQHVHYTIDVVAAPPLTFVVYWLAKKFVSIFQTK